MIKGYCRTNLDGYEREYWPHVFCAVPRVGESVAAESGRSLKVCYVTHHVSLATNKVWPFDLSVGEPFIEVELTKSF